MTPTKKPHHSPAFMPGTQLDGYLLDDGTPVFTQATFPDRTTVGQPPPKTPNHPKCHIVDNLQPGIGPGIIVYPNGHT